ncbi:calpastatin [Ctenodactylus gundi]
MNPTEAKAVKAEPEKEPQSTKPSVVHEKKSQEEKSKVQAEPESLPKHASDTGSKRAHSEKAVSRSSEQPTSEQSPEPKSGMDAALDDLVGTLGPPEETNVDNAPYAGPEISDPMFATYFEELGKKEITIPPKYRELLAKKGVISEPSPDSSKPLGPDDAIDALSSDFTCSSPTTGGKETKKEQSAGEVIKAQSADVIRSAAPPQEKKRKVDEDALSDQALDTLSASLGTREPEPELDLSSVKQVDEAKAKELRLKRCGEDEETVPAEYRLQPATDKDGKPLLPESEQKKSKPLSESELVDKLSEDFDGHKHQAKQPQPTEKAEKSRAAAPAPVAEPVSRTSLCSVQAAPPKPAPSKSTVPDDAVEALAGSLGKKEAEPQDEKPAVDKVKEKAKEEDREKLGEKEETIPPDYRLEEVKDKDGKPLLPKEPKEQLPPLSDDFLLDALSADFASPTDASSLKFDDAKLSAVISEVVSQSPASVTHSAVPPPDTARKDKEIDDALDQLSDSLGQREPDPNEDKPVEDKVKERAKAEHRDKLGERDDTLPPDYRHLLDNDGQDKPVKPPTDKSKESKKPADGQDPIDALSGDLAGCPSTAEASQSAAKDKNKKSASSSKAPKNGGKAKDSAKKTEEASKPKADKKSTS